MNRLFFLLLLVSGHVSSNNYLFPGCEIGYSNPIFTTRSDLFNITVAKADKQLPVTIQVTHDGTPFKQITFPLPDWQWSPILINMTEKLQVIHANNIYTNETYQEPLMKNPMKETYQKPLMKNQMKEIEVVNGRSVANCPQGLFYRELSHIKDSVSFPSPEEKTTDEVYILYPLNDLTVELSFNPPHKCCSPRHFLCWNETRLVIMNNSAECYEIPQFQYQWLKFHFENQQVEVMNDKGLVLDSLPAEDGSRVWFGTKDKGKNMFVIHCSKNCEPQNDALPPRQGTKYHIGLMVATRIVMILEIAFILECLRRLFQ